MNRRRSRCALVVVLLAAVLPGCPRREAEPAADHHEHHAPHGGALVGLGEHQGNLELVFDTETGRLQLYVLDAHAENFVRIAQPAVEMEVTADGIARPLVLAATANAITGETAGDTSLFEGRAEWLEGRKDFDGRVRSVTVRGVSYENIPFRLSGGHEPDDSHEHDHR